MHSVAYEVNIAITAARPFGILTQFPYLFQHHINSLFITCQLRLYIYNSHLNIHNKNTLRILGQILLAEN